MEKQKLFQIANALNKVSNLKFNGFHMIKQQTKEKIKCQKS